MATHLTDSDKVLEIQTLILKVQLLLTKVCRSFITVGNRVYFAYNLLQYFWSKPEDNFLSAVSPFLSSLLFAADPYQSRDKLELYLPDFNWKVVSDKVTDYEADIPKEDDEMEPFFKSNITSVIIGEKKSNVSMIKHIRITHMEISDFNCE